MVKTQRTKIVCTLGPASAKQATIDALVRAGLDIARINFSHGSFESNGALIRGARAAEKKYKHPIAMLQDIQGPRIRLGMMPGSVTLRDGQEVHMSSAPVEGYKPLNAKVTYLPVQFAIEASVQQGNRVLLRDGLIEIIVQGVRRGVVIGKVKSGGLINPRAGVNLPDSIVRIPILTAKDKADVIFGMEQGIDYIGVSFVQTAKDIETVRAFLQKNKSHSKTKTLAKLIAKIECQVAVNNFESILAAADGVMVARGDLGIEIPPERVPVEQKRIIELCVRHAKPVIVATQMLSSMVLNPRPTRAEASDVANAVVDRTDAVMMSDETALGKYPVEAASFMARVIHEMENSPYDDVLRPLFRRSPEIQETSIAHAAFHMARNANAAAIVTATSDGTNARVLSSRRPEGGVIAFTTDEKLARQLQLSWGVTPVLVKTLHKPSLFIPAAIKILRAQKLVKSGDTIVFALGLPNQKDELSVVNIREV